MRISDWSSDVCSADLSREARACETVAVVGESGCGKSTFAKVLMGLETATDGEVMFNGKDIAQEQVQKRSPQQVGSMQMVFQNPFDTLNPSHSEIGRASCRERVCQYV